MGRIADECPIHRRNRPYRFNEFFRPNEVVHIVRDIKSRASSPQQAIFLALHYVHTNIRYVTDIEKYGVNDLWQFPCETLQQRSGDCEDMAFLLASILMGLGFYYVRVVKGSLLDTGHAWVEVYDGAQWFLLESVKGKRLLLSEGKAQGYKAHLYIYPWGCITP